MTNATSSVERVEEHPPAGIGDALEVLIWFGGAMLEVAAASTGGAIGQWLRSLLSRRRFNQYGLAVLCAVVASGVYALIAIASVHAGFGPARHAAGVISSVLFLIPGFPVVAALLDLLQYQIVVAVTRFAYSAMMLLAAAFGLGFVAALVGFETVQPQTSDLAEPVKLLLRAIASFAGGSGFAIVYNSSRRVVIAVGLLASGANELRLALHDAGMMLAPATFFGA